MGDREVHHATCSSNGDSGHELCEFFPRIKLKPLPKHSPDEDIDSAQEEEDEADTSYPSEEGVGTGVLPPQESEVLASTPGVRVVDSEGKEVRTRPTLHAHRH